ncbi:MAG: hypothetical protein RMJ98_16685, partial [Myxococcales bacterium]|nr:hypothetical protein [Myxococcales bacterium]
MRCTPFRLGNFLLSLAIATACGGRSFPTSQEDRLEFSSVDSSFSPAVGGFAGWGSGTGGTLP